MNKDTLTLKDGTVIELEAGASLDNLRVVSGNGAAMLEVWGKFTEDNLSEVLIKNGDGVVVSNLTGLLLENETSAILKDGTILTSFNCREKTDVEKRLDAIEQGQTIQDAGILDMGKTISNLMEKEDNG